MLTVIASSRFRDHVPPEGHHERPARAEVMWHLAEAWRTAGGTVVEPRSATRAELRRVHQDRYLDLIAATAGRATSLDPDTHTSSQTHETALMAAGAALMAVERALSGDPSARRAYALVRPPGHHAEAGRAMGFCFYNNAAAAAAHALARGAARVAIVDYDVHHGNGTQWIFYDDPRVLYVSTHQFPFYPGTGAASDIGHGAGTGFTLNVPLEAGAGDGDYLAVFTRLVLPVLDQFRPDLIVVSAGFDAHERDPIAGMRMSAGGYAQLTRELCHASDRSCEGRLVLVTEGGYDLDALAACLQLTARLASGEPLDLPAIEDPATRRADAATAAVRAAQARCWRL